jgi:AhpD family alkylhydroperoxidase
MSTGLRLPYYQLSADTMAGFKAASAALAKGSLGTALLELVYLRISQINGCAYCLHMHSKALIAENVDAAKLHTLAGWRFSQHFSEAERAALNWAEALTRVEITHAADEFYEPLKEHFSDAQISDLTMAISLMNAFNRMAIGMKQ